MPSLTPSPPRLPLVIGVDSHKDTHVTVAVDAAGAVVATSTFATTGRGIAAAMAWSGELGRVATWAVEGTGCYGAGLARALLADGQHVLEINRPDRRTRRVLGGKTDLIDAEAAARSAIAGHGVAVPKSGDGRVELIRITRAARSSAVKARTAAMNQLKAVLITAPAPLRDRLGGLGPKTLIRRCASLRPAGDTAETGVKRTLRALARRWLLLDQEIAEHGTELARLVRIAVPRLLAQHGVGPDTAAALLIAAGDNPHRLTHEAAFAALCGTNPIPASSGKTDRHRLNRAGNRQANAALHRIIVVRLGTDPETRRYRDAHLSPNKKNTKHVIRCLKRALARRLYPLILEATTTLADPDTSPADTPTPPTPAQAA